MLAKALICLLFFCDISNGNDSLVVNRITIRYIFSRTDTQHDISCSDFDAYQKKGSFMVKVLRNTVQINLFMRSMREYKAPPLVKRIDVRAKAYIHYSSGKASIACIDQFGDIMLDDKFIGVSSSLLSFLKKNCNGFE
jgi:hypothetical protein